MSYEYLVTQTEVHSPMDTSDCNSLGWQGWELVAIVQAAPNLTYYFKKPKPRSLPSKLVLRPLPEEDEST